MPDKNPPASSDPRAGYTHFNPPSEPAAPGPLSDDERQQFPSYVSDRTFRIVANTKRPANKHGHFPWQCTLCGAAVAHVDRHAAWHERVDGIRYGDPLPEGRADG